MTIHLNYRDPERRARLQAALLEIAVMCRSACLDDEGDRQKVAEAMTLGVLHFMNEEMINALHTRQVRLDALRRSVGSLTETLTPDQAIEMLTMLSPEQHDFVEKFIESSTFGKRPASPDATPAPDAPPASDAEPNAGDAP